MHRRTCFEEGFEKEEKAQKYEAMRRKTTKSAIRHGLIAKAGKGRNYDHIFYAMTALIAIFYLFLRLQTPQRLRPLLTKESHEQNFLSQWVEHISQHPIQARDRTGFAEMGLRANLYLELLQYPRIKNFDQFEAKLWPFVSKIKDLRLDCKSMASGKAIKKRGIVMSLGHGDFRFAIHFLEQVRNVHKSEMPFEFFYYGEEDLPGHYRSYISERYSKVAFVDLESSGIFDPLLAQLYQQGWALKPFAMIASSFSEMLLADADTVLLMKPEDLFEESGYRELGTLFFHDRNHYREGASVIIHDFLKDQIGRGKPSRELEGSAFWKSKGIYQQESGVVLLDKSRPELFTALLLTAWQNTGGVRDLTTYRVFWGEKESYWLSFELMKIPYHFVQDYAGAIGAPERDSANTLCSEHPMHFIDKMSASGKKERTPAWFNGGLLDSKHASSKQYINAKIWAREGTWNFRYESEQWCFEPTVAYNISNSNLEIKIQGMIQKAHIADHELLKVSKHL